MVMISNVDHVLALVRGQLERLGQGRRVTSGKKAERGEAVRATGKSRLRALSNLSDISDEEFEQLLVGALLSHEFGEEAAQDPRFRSVVERTADILRSDDELRKVMQTVRQSLRKTDAADPGD